MERMVIALLLVSAVRPQDDEGRIIGGYTCIPHSQPWQAYVTGRYICGGTLIGASWVVTAAHCLSRNMVVRLGEHNLHVWEGTEQFRYVVRAIRHPQFNPRTLDNDIMLLKLDRSVPASRNIRALRLPLTCSRAGTSCLVTGWGTVRSPQAYFPDVLRCANVRMTNQQSCEATYQRCITRNMICAGVQGGGVDTCQGDSGGPLVCNGQLEGIVSWGMETCAQSGYPGVYTKVCNYTNWLREVMRRN